MRKAKAVIERAGDGTYSIYSDADDLTYLITGTGNSLKEAKQCFEDGYLDMKRYYKEEGKVFTEVEMYYVYDLGSFLSYYAKVISLAGLAKLTGIKIPQLKLYITGKNTPTPRTTKKILDRIHAFAEDLATCQTA